MFRTNMIVNARIDENVLDFGDSIDQGTGTVGRQVVVDHNLVVCNLHHPDELVECDALDFVCIKNVE